MTDEPYHIRIDDKAFPWAASRVTRRGTYNPKAVLKKSIQWQIHLQWKGRPVLEKPLEVWFAFGFKPPKNTPKKKKAAMISGMIKHTVKPDTTNLQKSCEDCLKKIVIKDDNLIFRIHSEKFWADEDHIAIALLEHEDICP
jgi:Holliday junction resolvase RusA-like endonuclease